MTFNIHFLNREVEAVEKTQDLLAKIKVAKEVQNLSYQDIADMTARNGEAVSKATVARVLQPDARLEDFRYNQTIRPIVRAVLGDAEAAIVPEYIRALQQEETARVERSGREQEAFLQQVIDDMRGTVKWYKRLVIILSVGLALSVVALFLSAVFMWK